MNDRFKFRYVFEKDFGGKIGICYKMPVFNLDDAVRSVFENKIIEYTNFGYKLIAKNQCTGLKDKNGKLIFEGDIVRFIYGNKKRLGYVEENKTVWSITNSNFCQGAWCGGALINLYETCEIIGNIYENPELLEDTECQK